MAVAPGRCGRRQTPLSRSMTSELPLRPLRRGCQTTPLGSPIGGQFSLSLILRNGLTAGDDCCFCCDAAMLSQRLGRISPKRYLLTRFGWANSFPVRCFNFNSSHNLVRGKTSSQLFSWTNFAANARNMNLPHLDEHYFT